MGFNLVAFATVEYRKHNQVVVGDKARRMSFLPMIYFRKVAVHSRAGDPSLLGQQINVADSSAQR